MEALSAKEEYDSEPTTTSSDESDVSGSGSDAERKREEKRIAKKERREQREKEKSEKGEKKRERKKKSGGGGGGGERRERKKKLVKLPGQPKKASSSYFIWMNATRDSIKNDNPGATIGEIAKKAGELWKALGDKSVGSGMDSDFFVADCMCTYFR